MAAGLSLLFLHVLARHGGGIQAWPSQPGWKNPAIPFYYSMNADVIDAIDSERRHQEHKFPGHTHTQGEYVLILRKLLHDAEHTWYHNHSGHSCTHHFREIAAVCSRAMEEHGAPLRHSP
jgi:hypothetical protein